MSINVYGYVRVSTREQNEGRQMIALEELSIPEENLFIDKQSGKDFRRPQYKKMVKMLINRDHTAMIEHSMLSVKFIVDRGVSHEIVRHRISSFAQESTRYCNYAKDKFHNEITVIRPNFFLDETSKAYQQWEDAMRSAEKSYFSLMEAGATPQEARSVLPNSTKTEITMTANYREWRNFFKLRTDKAAHPQMREVAVPLLKELQKKLPIVFDDIIVEE